MLQFDPRQRIGFAQIKEYLNKLTPSNNKPISRTMTEHDEVQSAQLRQRVEKYVQYNLTKMNYMLNVVKMLKIQNQLEYSKEFMPNVYQLFISYLSIMRYLKMNETFSIRLVKPQSGLLIQMVPFKQIFQKMILADRSKVTQLTDNTLISMNRIKQEVRAIARYISRKMKNVLSGQEYILQRRLAQEIEGLRESVDSYVERRQFEEEQVYCEGIQYLVGNLFLTTAELNYVAQTELRSYLLLLIVAKLDEQLSWQQYLEGYRPITFTQISQMKQPELLLQIKRVNKQKSTRSKFSKKTFQTFILQ